MPRPPYARGVEKPATLLRARFGELAQLQKHLHVVEGRTVFFFREPAARLMGGDRVVVEFSVASSEQVSTLRGSVLGRVNGEGGQVGAWIEFPDAKLAKRLERGSAALAMRQHQRVTCDLLVEVRQGRHAFLARMTDVSMGGARVLGAAAPRLGAQPLRPGSQLELRIMGHQAPFPHDLGRAEVVRTDEHTGELAEEEPRHEARRHDQRDRGLWGRTADALRERDDRDEADPVAK